MRARTQLGTLGVALASAGLVVYLTSVPAPQPAQPVALAPPDPFAFVKSMEGTRPDGALRQGEEGQLVVDAELGHLFDYYLAGLGEKDLNAIRAEIERELDRRLAPGPSAQAKRLLASYLAYKGALAQLEPALAPHGSMLEGARARLAAQQQLRQRYFSAADSAGLFGASDAYDSDALARLALHEDRSLSAAQRAEKLAALDARLPPAMREDRAAPMRVVKLEESVQKMRAGGASEDEIFRLRAAAFSPEAANRLAEVDREESAWQARIARYLAARAALAPDASTALQQLRDQSFTADEQRRLGAYE